MASNITYKTYWLSLTKTSGKRCRSRPKVVDQNQAGSSDAAHLLPDHEGSWVNFNTFFFHNQWTGASDTHCYAILGIKK
jgi:hypothetical protein